MTDNSNPLFDKDTPLPPFAAGEDLAFLRRIVDERQSGMQFGGFLYFAAGLLYAAQCLISVLAIRGIIPDSAMTQLIATIVANGGFFGLMFWTILKNRKAGPLKGVANRALAASFTGAGFANIVLALMFGIIAYQRKDFSIWLIYPAVVAALQGAVWYIAGAINRRLWMRAVAGGWLVSAFILGLTARDPLNYLTVLTVALLFFMALPGWKLYKTGQPDSDRKGQ